MAIRLLWQLPLSCGWLVVGYFCGHNPAASSSVLCVIWKLTPERYSVSKCQPKPGRVRRSLDIKTRKSRHRFVSAISLLLKVVFLGGSSLFTVQCCHYRAQLWYVKSSVRPSLWSWFTLIMSVMLKNAVPVHFTAASILYSIRWFYL